MSDYDGIATGAISFVIVVTATTALRTAMSIRFIIVSLSVLLSQGSDISQVYIFIVFLGSMHAQGSNYDGLRKVFVV